MKREKAFQSNREKMEVANVIPLMEDELQKIHGGAVFVWKRVNGVNCLVRIK